MNVILVEKKYKMDNENRVGDYITTFTGKSFYLLDPRPKDICIEDIAHALSNLCRFTGHCKSFYSVAQHSVLVSYDVPHPFQIDGLLHDATEAYTNDVSSPLKRNIFLLDGRPFSKLEDSIEEVIYKALNIDRLDPSFHIMIKNSDLRAFCTEYRDLIGVPREGGGTEKLTRDYGTFVEKIEPLSPKEAETLFLNRFKELYEKVEKISN